MVNIRDCEGCGRSFGGGNSSMCPLCQRRGKIKIFDNGLFDKELTEPIKKYGKVWALPLFFLLVGGQFGMELHASNPAILPVVGLALGAIIAAALLFVQRGSRL